MVADVIHFALTGLPVLIFLINMKFIKSISKHCTVILTLFIILFSTIPVGIGSGILFQDKIIHFFIYGLLALLSVQAAYAQNMNRPEWRGFYYAFFLGLFLEFVQFFLPYRSFDIVDIVFNTVGAGLGTFISYKLARSLFS